MTLSLKNLKIISGAILKNGHCNRALFRVLKAVLMIWDNFSIFGTNCAIVCSTRAYMLRGFLHMSRRANDVLNSRSVWMLLAHNSPQLNTSMSVRILFHYFRRKLIQFEWSKTVLNLVMSRSCSAVFFTKASHYSTPSFTCRYGSVVGLESLPPLATRFARISPVYHDPKDNEFTSVDAAQ